MADTAYLKKQNNSWMVVVEIPKPLRKKAGKARFKLSLRTDSLATANRLKHSHVAEFKRQIALLAAGQEDTHAKLYRLAAEFRHQLEISDKRVQEGPNGHEFSEYEEELDRLKEQAREIEADQGSDAARKFFKAAKGEATLLKDMYPLWLAESQHAEQTKGQHKATINQYLDWSDENVTVEETDRRKAGTYVSHLLTKSGHSRKTVKRHVSSLSSFWRWLIGRGVASENPWRGQELGKKSTLVTRKGLDDEAILKLLNGRSRSEKFAQVLSDLLRLALLTGARLDELCSLKSVDVSEREDGYWLTVTEGKTEASARDIPLHQLGVPIIERRLRDKEEYLFAGLQPAGPDNKRMWYVSKAYGRYRKQEDVGVKERWQDFHALRNTFIDMMEGAGAPESTVKLLVGHKRESMTYGHYSKGARVNLRSAIQMLDYGHTVMSGLARRSHPLDVS